MGAYKAIERRIIAENVFIYSPWNGRLKMYEGTVTLLF